MTVPTYEIRAGDCREVMAAIPDASISAIVSDPPYELGMMGKKWDSSGIAYDGEVWRQALRVLKPGGYLLAFGGTRTYHRMACAIEDAGFAIRDSLHWIYGSGFPKSLDASRAIDRAAGAEREVVGHDDTKAKRAGCIKGGYGVFRDDNFQWNKPAAFNITTPATDAARQWEGWGTALKPAHEPVVMARKPLEGTVAANLEAHGCGAINVDGCRVGETGALIWRRPPGLGFHGADGSGVGNEQHRPHTGRWPPNVLLSHSPACRMAGTKQVKRGGGVPQTDENHGMFGDFGRGHGRVYGDGAGIETVARWICVPGCPVLELDAAAGADVSRYFPIFHYEAKAARAEREEGTGALHAKERAELTGRKPDSAGLVGTGDYSGNPYTGANWSTPIRNHHPTVKPLGLMRWLVRLVTPPSGVVLDPFAGSGSTVIAAALEQVSAIGIELSPEYAEIARARLEAWRRTDDARQLPLFGEVVA